MLSQQAIDRNMKLYLAKMEQKYQQQSQMLIKLQQHLHGSAKKIQRRFKMFMMKRKTKAALKIQRNYKKYLMRKQEYQQKIQRFRRVFSSYRIYYFLKRITQQNKSLSQKNLKVPKKIEKNRQLPSILKNIALKSSKYMAIMSAFRSQLAYIKKYQAYDRKAFFQEWEAYEKRQREWMWSQIKKKWVKKQGEIWINQQQKEVNAEKYVKNLIEQGYNKHYQSFEESQKRLKQSQNDLMLKIKALTQSFQLSVLSV